jgi:RHS repeat-associated protein
LQGYSYDAAGNMTHDLSTGANYTYDQENRITGAAGYSYNYDADGNRVEKSNGTTGTLYWYMTPGIVAESDLSGNLQSEYVFFDGERVARRDLPSGSVAYYFSDNLKTASVITDVTGNIKSESDYYPWGGELQFINGDSNHYKFTAHERDSETGLDYFGARYYANGLGRFITPDWAAKPAAVPYAVLGDPQSLNLYTYVRNIPTTNVDTDGHETLNANNNDRGNTNIVPCNTQQCRDFDRKMANFIFGGFAATLTAGAASGPEALLLARNLLGIGLATAPITVPIATNLIEGATPGAPSLTAAFGIGKVEQVYEGFSVGRFSNGAEIAARITTSGENTTVSVLGAFNAGGGKSVAGTLNAIEKGATAAAQKAGSSSVTLQAVAITNPKLAKLLTKQGFVKATIQVGKDKLDVLQKTFQVKRPGE